MSKKLDVKIGDVIISCITGDAYRVCGFDETHVICTNHGGGKEWFYKHHMTTANFYKF